uniref:RNase H domain-containing protein n=1 Tax=Rhodnius prolixus TaxID=13249 RepID=T1HWN4_RHOPR
MERVITSDESWVFEYDPETKRQSIEWHTSTSPRPKKYSKKKANRVHLIWIKGHTGLKGNEIVDRKAKETISLQHISPYSMLVSDIKNYAKAECYTGMAADIRIGKGWVYFTT